jgi:hypothetical protein
MGYCFHVFISLHHLSPRFAGRSWKKLPAVGKNREILVQAFRSTASPAAYPGVHGDRLGVRTS